MVRKSSMVSVEEARNTILAHTPSLPPEIVPLFEAPGRVLSRDIVSNVDIPAVDNSAMDGYALVASDTAGAAKDRPARLPVRGEIRAGLMEALPDVAAGRAVRIMTGAPMPHGADSVVQFEDTAEEGEHVLVFREV